MSDEVLADACERFARLLKTQNGAAKMRGFVAGALAVHIRNELTERLSPTEERREESQNG